jgi:hypothetical protein
MRGTGPKHRNTGEDPTCGALEYDEGAKGVNFQDQYPMQVVSEASLEGARQLVRDVVTQGGQQIEHLDPAKWPEQRIQDLTIERWRPNIVVSGPLKPFEEDGWESIEVGPDRKVIYTVVRCARWCVSMGEHGVAERSLMQHGAQFEARDRRTGRGRALERDAALARQAPGGLCQIVRPVAVHFIV